MNRIHNNCTLLLYYNYNMKKQIHIKMDFALDYLLLKRKVIKDQQQQYLQKIVIWLF